MQCVLRMNILLRVSEEVGQRACGDDDIRYVVLTMTRATRVNTPSNEKYTMNAGRLKSSNRSSKECVGSATIPNSAMRTAPPAMHKVLMIIHGENTSPRMSLAKNAFHSKETAPSGARMTTGRDAIWKIEPKRFEDMKIPVWRMENTRRTSA